MRRTSGTGTESSARRAASCGSGFTLIEVLVVIVIIGIVVALAAVNLFETDTEAARRETGIVALAIERARDAAWFGGRPVALSFGEGRLRRWRLAGSDWQADAGAGDALDPATRVTAIYVEGQPLAPGARLVFLPDGLGTAFRVALEVRGIPTAIDGDAAGSVAVAQ